MPEPSVKIWILVKSFPLLAYPHVRNLWSTALTKILAQHAKNVVHQLEGGTKKTCRLRGLKKITYTLCKMELKAPTGHLPRSLLNANPDSVGRRH